MEEPILEFIKTRLGEDKGDWPRVARESAVPYGTIINIMSGKVADPGVETCQKLIDYFHAKDAMLAKLRAA